MNIYIPEFWKPHGCTCPDPLPTTLGTLRLTNKDCPIHGQGAKG